MKKTCFSLVLVGMLTAPALRAALVQEVSVSPGVAVNLNVSVYDGSVWSTFYNGGALAGIYNLKVDGVLTPSFCIDVLRFSPVGDQTYSYSALSSAPLAPSGPMPDPTAEGIQKLWGAYFSGAQADATGLEAAALQVAIWRLVDSVMANYTVSINGDSSSDPVYSRSTFMLANLGTKKADLIALVNEDYQNYVVPVPETGTLLAGALLLLPLGLSTVRALRRR